MWFQVESANIGFIESAPFRFQNEAIILTSPTRLFEIVSNAEGQKKWFPDFVSATWTSEQTHCVGSTRNIQLKLLTVKERFLLWEPGQRLTFTVEASTLPILEKVVEDFQFASVGNGATRFRWNVYYQPKTLMRAVHPLARMMFGRMFAHAVRGLSAYAIQSTHN